MRNTFSLLIRAFQHKIFSIHHLLDIPIDWRMHAICIVWKCRSKTISIHKIQFMFAFIVEQRFNVSYVCLCHVICTELFLLVCTILMFVVHCIQIGRVPLVIETMSRDNIEFGVCFFFLLFSNWHNGEKKVRKLSVNDGPFFHRLFIFISMSQNWYLLMELRRTIMYATVVYNIACYYLQAFQPF